MKIHFIGINGIGISALAKYHAFKGNQISGSDLTESDLTKSLKENGGDIYIGKQVTENIKDDLDLVIYSPAVKKDNPELKRAIEKKIKTLNYPQALGELSKDFFTIAVSGTHGKSTTTSMIALLLIEAGLDPTVIVGTKLKEFNNSNCRIGNSKYLVIEACEHEASFLNYHPQIGIILNMEADHLDYYKNIENIHKSFNQFANQSEKVIINKKDKNIISKYDLIFNEKEEEIKLALPGEHIKQDALAAITCARELRIDDNTSLSALSKFKGTWRRFDIDDANFDFTIINDYAHHPTEIETTLKAIREKYKDNRIYCVFQPHQYERTYNLFDKFVKVFKDAIKKNYIDKLILYPIYTVLGRESEEVLSKVSSEKLRKTIQEETIFIESFNEINIFIKNNLKKDDILIIMGAGNIYNLYQFLLDNK